MKGTTTHSDYDWRQNIVPKAKSFLELSCLLAWSGQCDSRRDGWLPVQPDVGLMKFYQDLAQVHDVLLVLYDNIEGILDSLE